MHAKYGVHLLTHSGYLKFCYIKMLINQKTSRRTKGQEENNKIRQALEKEKLLSFYKNFYNKKEYLVFLKDSTK